MRTFVIADLHLKHPMLIEKNYRPHDYEKMIIKRWNNLINEDDIVIVLGDTIMSFENELPEYLKQLKGIKVLTRGNHDKRSHAYYIKAGFQFSCDFFALGEILFSHEPMDLGAYKWNIHGHFHEQIHRNRMEPKYRKFYCDKHILFSLEDEDYFPRELYSFIQKHEKKLANNANGFSRWRYIKSRIAKKIPAFREHLAKKALHPKVCKKEKT